MEMIPKSTGTQKNGTADCPAVPFQGVDKVDTLPLKVS